MILERTVGANQDILRLHVSVDDPVSVQVAQRLHKLPCNCTHFGLWQLSIIFKHFKKLACIERSFHCINT